MMGRSRRPGGRRLSRTAFFGLGVMANGEVLRETLFSAMAPGRQLKSAVESDVGFEMRAFIKNS